MRFINAINIYAVAVMLIPSVVSLIILEIILFILTTRELNKKNDLPSISVLAKAEGWWKAIKYFGRVVFSPAIMWRADKVRWRGAVIGVCLGISAVLLALQSTHYDEFGSAGALITVIALYSEFFGSRNQTIESREKSTSGTEAVMPPGIVTSTLLTNFVERAKYTERRRASLWMLIITILGTLIWAYGGIFLQKIVDPQNSAVNVPPLAQSKPEPELRVFTASMSEAELQRLMAAFESFLSDLRFPKNLPPGPAQDTQGITKSLDGIETDLKQIASDTARIPSPDLSQRDPSSTPNGPYPGGLRPFIPEQVAALQADQDALKADRNAPKGGHLTAEQRKAIVLREQRELNRHGAHLSEDGIEGKNTKAALYQVPGLKM